MHSSSWIDSRERCRHFYTCINDVVEEVEKDAYPLCSIMFSVFSINLTEGILLNYVVHKGTDNFDRSLVLALFISSFHTFFI